MHTIQIGIQIEGNTPNTTQHYDPINNISVITNNLTGTIITVTRGH